MTGKQKSFRELMAAAGPVQAHLIGVRGAGMRSLACCLKRLGWQLTGSDSSATSPAHVAESGFPVFQGHAAYNLPATAEVVIHSLAVPEDNPELQAARRQQCEILSYAATLGELSRSLPTIAIAGTHGKTTTSCLLSHLLSVSGTSHTLISGGRLLGNTSPEQGTEQPGWLVAESCEFRQSFLQLTPQIAVLLSVEPDHFDCYPDETKLLEAFRAFCKQLPQDGCLVVNTDSPLAVRATETANCRVVRFGLEQEKSVDWRARSLRETAGGTEFELQGPGGEVFVCQLPLFGRHQVSNALAALLAAKSCGVDLERCLAGLDSFPGVERRFQARGTYNGWQLIDDYAHHPTEIRATLAAARQRYEDCPLTVAFQPHQIQRTAMLLDDFAKSLRAADQVFVLPVFAARETADERIVTMSQQLVERGRELGGEFEFCPSLDQLRLILDDKRFAGPETGERVFLTLGAGDIDRIFYELPG